MNAPHPEFDFEGAYGEAYEALAHRLIPGYGSTFEMTVALLRGRLGPAARILVVGAGTGIEIASLMRHEPAWRCVGVDPARRMLELAEHRIAEAGVTGHRLVHGYVHDLPAEPVFSAATCFNVMHFLPDDGAKAGLLADIAARLEPGAPLVLFDLCGEPGSAEHDEAYAAWRAYWTIRGMEPDAQRAFRAKLDAGIHWIGEPRVRLLLTGAGFAETRLWYRSLVYGGWIATRG